MNQNQQRGPRHRGVIVLFLFAALMIVALPAMAAKGGGKHGGGGGASGGGSFSLVLMDGATQPQRGVNLTFNVSAPGVDRPYVGLRCWQGTTWMYDAYVGYFPQYMFDQWFLLDSPYWADGVGATCTARLFYYNSRGGENSLATPISFEAAA